MIDVPEIEELDVSSKRVLCRFDFNVPLRNGEIVDDWRIKAAIPTIKYLIDHKARIILMSHLGRPKGEPDSKLSLRPVAERLGEILNKKVDFISEQVGDKVRKRVDELKKGELLLLENTRFYPEEKENEPSFAKKLSGLADIYINDAFGTAHRKHASTFGVAKYVKEKAIGLLMKKELENLHKLMENPKKPFTMILGGAKLKTKIPVVKKLADYVDYILVGGGMAFVFLVRKGIDVGDSLVEESLFDDVDDLFNILEDKDVKLMLPDDAVIVESIEEEAEYKTVDIKSIPAGWKGVDIGEETIKKFSEIIRKSETVFWNGPLGVYEINPFDRGTREIAKVLGEVTDRGAFTIVGGGDTDHAVKDLSVDISHISTGGGASLKFLSGEELPSIKVLR